MDEILERIAAGRIIPVIQLDSPEQALPLGEALVKGGLPVAEITFRTDAAEEAIRRMAKAYPQISVGAGTVTTAEQARRAVGAGAGYIVSPGVSRRVIEYCLEKGVPVLGGACTPSEIMILMEYGLKVAKFFPAEAFGGLRTIRALAGPFPAMKFMPTGGINAGNVLEYLAFSKVVACGGSWMVPSDAIASGNFGRVESLVREAVRLVRNAPHLP